NTSVQYEVINFEDALPSLRKLISIEVLKALSTSLGTGIAVGFLCHDNKFVLEENSNLPSLAIFELSKDEAKVFLSNQTNLYEKNTRWTELLMSVEKDVPE